MGWFAKLADAAKDRIEGAGAQDTERGMGRIASKDLKQLSDAELDAELVRRRRARGQNSPAPIPREEPLPKARRAAPEPANRRDRAPGWKVRQWYRDLELEPGASLAEVESAYQRLLDRYDPDKHIGDAEKHRAATRLAAGLGEAYYALKDELGG